MIEDLRYLFTSYPWTTVYGPFLLVTVLTWVFKVLTGFFRERQWEWFKRSHFYLGLPLLWASFGRVLGDLVTTASANPPPAADALDPFLRFFVSWLLLFWFVFALHAAYDQDPAKLLDDMRSDWNRKVDKWRHEQLEIAKAKAKQEQQPEPMQVTAPYPTPAPDEATIARLQRRNLTGYAVLMGLASFMLYDYLFKQVLIPPVPWW
jgi:hypothetical protein